MRVRCHHHLCLLSALLLSACAGVPAHEALAPDARDHIASTAQAAGPTDLRQSPDVVTFRDATPNASALAPHLVSTSAPSRSYA